MKLLKFLCAIILFAGISLDISAQSKYLSGYGKAVSGVNFAYPSPHSYNDPCYLTRATKDVGPMEWETVVVPKNHTGKTVSFIWVYGMDVTHNPEAFDLSINDKKVLTFKNPGTTEEKNRTIHGDNGVSLNFIQSMVDSNRDEMGYAVLTMPTSIVTLGAPVKLKIGGVPNNSNAWYMTYKISPKNNFNAHQLKVIKKEADKLFSVIRFSLVHLGKPINANVLVEGESKKVKLNTGLNEIDFLIPKVEKPKTIEAEIEYGNSKEQISVALNPIKEWTIYLVQHSHTDIGYTRQQSEILAEHLRYIDDALDYCDQTDHYPKEAQFRWTCEVAWTVREYINSRPKEQVDRLIQRVKEGRIEVTGMFLNYSETIDETALAIQLQALKKFKAKGIDVTTAMQNDVNGIGWCMPDMYEGTGVKYLTMGVHAHRARLPFSKPTSFWWESPSGKRLLAYRSEHYMHGNALALVSGEMDVFGNNLSKYLDGLEEKNYPFDRVAFQFSGYTTDNSPPSTKACDIIKKWNDTYEWPKLKSALASEFMVHIEKNHPDDIETKKVSWPDWWTDGFGSAMKETKVLRNSYSQMLATMGLLSMVQASGGDIPKQIHDEVRNCYDNLLLYSEHTFGAAESIRDPYNKNTMDQWSQKSSYIWSANQQSNLLREKAIGLIQPHVKIPKAPSVTVFNTLNWSRSGIAEVFIDYDILPLDKKTSIVDSNGNEIPTQIIRQRAEGTYWALWVKDVPPLGYATYTIQVADEKATSKDLKLPVTTTVENSFYKIQIDEVKKGIISIYDKTLHKELLDTQSKHTLGSMVYERIKNRRDLERLTATRRDTVFKSLNEKHYKFSSFKIEKITDGNIWKSIICKAQLPECAEESSGITLEIRLHHHKKEIEFLYNMKKLDIIEPEGLYVAFPFANENAQLVFEAQGGPVRPGIDQLAGSASDWNTIQNYASVKSDDSQILFCSEDTPLVQFGGINTGRYYYKNPVKNKGHIYSWVLNNYWVTNFRASQFGELNWRYQITSSENKSNTFATKFGWGNRVPFVSKANSGKEKSKNNQISESLIDLGLVDNLLLVHARPTENNDGVILHLRETEGDHAILDINKILENSGINEVYLVNSLGEIIKKLTAPFLVEHFETRFILLKTK
ncbi:glycoside hydrolase family 38 C-terminal domain-containing protein [Tamlana crocina]|uniref:Glycosyl hydrolase family 38 n=1 Tax=Tamlana crocina TaxID=393006 RepID=A0ABX1DBH8_9FLAO|nr:glycoside hydrolase family 38 C-terminal domain-containing protein [Tamlana crocina]NJX14388.1 glycosyl hydrolase family 38 [Tamlana crocina]